jgi:two-component system NtrC family sensor kinase
MKAFCLLLIFTHVFFSTLQGQNRQADSLKQVLEKTPQDTNRVNLLNAVASAYFFSKPDTSLVFAEEAIKLAKTLHYKKGEAIAMNNAGESLRFLGDYPRALKMQFDALEIHREMKNQSGETSSLGYIGFTYIEFREYRQGLKYLQLADSLHRYHNYAVPFSSFILSNIGNAYDLLGRPDSALSYHRQAYEELPAPGQHPPPLRSLLLTRFGNSYAGLGKNDSALQYYHMALVNSVRANDRVNLSKIHKKIAEMYESTLRYDSVFYYARQAFVMGQNTDQKLEIHESSAMLARLHRKSNNYDSAFFYQDISIAMSDSLYGPQRFKELQLLMLQEQQKQQEIQQEQERYKNKAKMIALGSAVGVFLIIAFLLYRNNREKQKTNRTLQKTLSDLRATQSQLVQSEKMASLGELTAGIAHEIQNPLNFVNNFSEVNDELLKELKMEAEKGNLEEVRAIANDIQFNSEKINYHGKRADSIVKGMLQHSRTSTGQKEPTDINALADEYLRLAYHGLRAKDKSFNATTVTEFDNSIGKINVVPQEIGRVILNLINNAFYAVSEKHVSARFSAGQADSATNNYEPTVVISTKKEKDKVEIKVQDNGNGIPQSILDKIFQPFFTTKPTGQGTGLGLSLAYDIVKAHGGELKVESRENEGSAFKIELPLT